MQKHKEFCKRFLLTIVSFVLSVSSVTAEETKIIKLFLLGGQSNMVGADKAAKLRPPYNKPFPKIKIWDPKNKTWAPLSPEVVNTGGRFGPEISLGTQLQKRCLLMIFV